ncbi:hypothetical protein [Acinetobacter larvae]|uniref:Uncharacterized protein n=1 Tax=Acinetobacter larvae TaxID=1789224 RepID=A0A1B2LWN4_9GAMM|nr:hypothetical protein [Acinetobacter larvae]AOA57356.1 hypothetical protein BFG52_02605 [Acinetobacter larvae]
MNINIDKIFINTLLVLLLSLNTTLANTHAIKYQESKMIEENIYQLILEIKRVGFSERWNSSKFFRGPLSLHVLKDGTVTDSGKYSLPSNVVSNYPAAIRVSGVNDKNRQLVFIVSPTSMAAFKSDLVIPFKWLLDHQFKYEGVKSLGTDGELNYPYYKGQELFEHSFLVYEEGRKATYFFSSKQKEIDKDLHFIQLAVIFDR